MNTSAGEVHHNDGDEEAAEMIAYAMQLVTGSVLPMTLKAAVELDVFEIISRAGADSKLSASEIAAMLPTTNADAPLMLDRILRLLASHQVLGCSVKGLTRFYSLTPVSKYFVRNQDDVSLGPVVNLTLDKVFMQSWFELRNAVLEGGVPFNRAHGMHAFEYTGIDPRFNQVFNSAMLNMTMVMKDILESYEGFAHLNRLVDVGGGLGCSLNQIISKHPHIRGINFDLPHVIEKAPHYPGIEHLGGNMFESVPNGDAIFMKWILHDWCDDQCLKLLKNCYKSIPDKGKVIVVDLVNPAKVKTSAAAKFIAQLDVFMMTHNPGGKERTRHEFMALATGAGFRGINYVCSVFNYWVMEFCK